MWWVFRGLSNGVVTTRWPKRSDEYFDRFRATVDVLPNAGLNVYDVLRRQTLVLTKDAVEAINARFAEKEAA